MAQRNKADAVVPLSCVPRYESSVCVSSDSDSLQSNDVPVDPVQHTVANECVFSHSGGLLPSASIGFAQLEQRDFVDSSGVPTQQSHAEEFSFETDERPGCNFACPDICHQMRLL